MLHIVFPLETCICNSKPQHAVFVLGYIHTAMATNSHNSCGKSVLVTPVNECGW